MPHLAEDSDGSSDLWLSEAADYLRRSIKAFGPARLTGVRKAFALLVSRRDAAGESREGGSRRVARAAPCYRATSSFAFMRGGCCTSWARLEECPWQRLSPGAENEKDEWHLSSIDRDLTGVQGASEPRGGGHQHGRSGGKRNGAKWAEVVRNMRYSIVWRGKMLGETLIKQQRFTADAPTSWLTIS